MMKHILLAGLLSCASNIIALAVDPGAAAPNFKGTSVKSEVVSLAALKGKVVVLEWVNFDCPFVKKHYQSGNTPKLQKKYTSKGVVWLSINSSAAGKQGFLPVGKMVVWADKEGSAATHFIMDTDGKIGRAYGAKVTPHMIIIGKEGKVAYNGAMDSKATTNAADVATAEPWFVNALNAVMAGKAVENAKNKPYGCSVKY